MASSRPLFAGLDRLPMWADADAMWLAWLVGFIDGEGCFYIRATNKGTTYAVCFSLKLRADDTPVLQEIVDRTGIGTLFRDARSVADSPNAKPTIKWHVQKQQESIRLVELIDAFPLRTKKRRDYEIWRLAAIAWANAPSRNNDWTPFMNWKREIEETRQYREVTQ